MKKFLVEVTRVETMEIEVDDVLWNEENLETYSQVMTPLNSVEDVAHLAAQLVAHEDEHGLKGIKVKRFGRAEWSFQNREI